MKTPRCLGCGHTETGNRRKKMCVWVCLCVLACVSVCVLICACVWVHPHVHEFGTQTCRACSTCGAAGCNEPLALKALIMVEARPCITKCPQPLEAQAKRNICFTFLGCTCGSTALKVEVLHPKGHLEVEEKHSEQVMQKCS